MRSHKINICEKKTMFALVLSTENGRREFRGEGCHVFGRDSVDFISNCQVEGEHLVIKYSRKRRAYELYDSLSVHGTWIPIGNYIPPIHDGANIPNSHAMLRACILQKGALFTVGGFKFAVTRCPSVRKRYASKYTLAPSTTAKIEEDQDVVEEMIDDEEHELVLACSPTHAPYMQQTFRISYIRGGSYISIGKGDGARLKVPANHPNAQHVSDVHCRILPIMGCFWLVDGDANSRSACGTYVRLQGVYMVAKASPMFCMYLGSEPVYVNTE